MAEFRMPSLGADMEAGTLVEWMVKPGDRVKRGDVVAVVETQKGAIEIEIFEAGQVERILVDVGDKVPVGAALAHIRSDHEVKAGVAEAPRALEPVVPAITPSVREPTRLKLQVAAPPAALGRVRASPVARRFASAHDIDISAIVGTGPYGAIVLADVERTTGAVVVAPAVERKRAGLDLNAMRVAIAAAMARSKREIPHYYLQHQIDLTECEAFLSRTNAPRQPDDRLLMGVLLVKAVALAARRFPAFNGFHQDGEFKPSVAIHVGVAIAIRGGGLAAPAIHDGDRLSLDELMARMRDLVQRVRAGRIRSSEMTDSTITISSLGERGVEALYGIIYPPQVAIVGFGKVLARPWIVDGVVVPRSIAMATLAADHRVSDGHAGALFLEPEKL
jgi:pyruvate dehydrogenase E2 component (dihydrolipoyllysine-residue acetyltransferase)